MKRLLQMRLRKLELWEGIVTQPLLEKIEEVMKLVSFGVKSISLSISCILNDFLP